MLHSDAIERGTGSSQQAAAVEDATPSQATARRCKTVRPRLGPSSGPSWPFVPAKWMALLVAVACGEPAMLPQAEGTQAKR
jgi:hypothetical protein